MDERWDRIAGKLERILDRVELMLEGFSPPPFPDATFFDGHLAFRWRRVRDAGAFVPVEHPHLPSLDDLVGIDMARDELIRNTGQFVEGYPANNVLLWGERGTGKSTCVKGLLRHFGNQGLRLVEVHRDDLCTIPAIVAPLRKVPQRFILFCDDLSFGEGEGGVPGAEGPPGGGDRGST